MSSTSRTWRPARSRSRSLTMRTTPLVLGRAAVGRDRHEVELDGKVDRAGEVAHEHERPLEDPDEQRIAARVVRRDLCTELSHPSGEILLGDKIFPRSGLPACTGRGPYRAVAAIRSASATSAGSRSDGAVVGDARPAAHRRSRSRPRRPERRRAHARPSRRQADGRWPATGGPRAAREAAVRRGVRGHRSGRDRAAS